MSLPRIKLYPPHLDATLTLSDASELVSDATNVIKHPFFPFLERNQAWTKYADKGTPKDKVKHKDRPIRYASRRDSYIFSHYRKILFPMYERELEDLGIGHCVIAYRRVKQQNNSGGKCNIHFASDAFSQIEALRDCVVIALDIEKFFENLQHEHLLNIWWRLLGRPAQQNRNWRLPPDHFQVFKAITKFSYLEVESVYREFGYIGEMNKPNGKKRIGYTVPRKKFPPRICTAAEFRTRLTDKIKQNPNPYGIPQGSTISDLLANAYMLDFDSKMNEIISELSGKYYRYSDDILIIVPSHVDWRHFIVSIQDIMNTAAPGLNVHPKKTQVYEYRFNNLKQTLECKILSSKTGADGIEYLGFRFDGKHVFLKNSTISGVRRKIARAVKSSVRHYINSNSDRTLSELKSAFDCSSLISKFGRSKDFDRFAYKSWTFWTYVNKAHEIFGQKGKPISKQFKDYKGIIRKKANDSFDSLSK